MGRCQRCCGSCQRRQLRGDPSIQNVAAGQVSATSTDAVNGSQLYEVAQKAAEQATVSAGDSNVVVTSTTNSSGGTDYEVKLADELEIGTASK